MRTKLLLGLCLLLAVFAYACDQNQCQSCGHSAGAQTVVSYANNAGQVTRVADSQGCVFYPPRNNSCSAVVTTIGGGFFASPSAVDLQSPPSDFSISGSGISSTYGMPKVQYWDGNNYMLGETTADYVAGDGSGLEAPTPNLSSAYSGYWTVFVLNKQSNGSYEIIGSAFVEAYGRNYCAPTQGEIDACEAGPCSSCHFDYELCQCVSGW